MELGDDGDPPTCAAHGVMLRFTAVRSSTGGTVAGVWKAWTPDASQQKLRWEMRRVFPSLGYNMASKYGRLNDRVRDLQYRWNALLQLVDMRNDEHWGKSMHAMGSQVQRREDPDNVEQEYWMSTTMLVLFLFDQKTSARHAPRKEAASLILSCMAEQCIGQDFCKAFVTTDVADFINECQCLPSCV